VSFGEVVEAVEGQSYSDGKRGGGSATGFSDLACSARIGLGTAHDKRFQVDEALAEYQAAEQASPDFAGVHWGLGFLYWKRDEVDKAEAEFRAELKRFPSDPLSNYLLGQIEMRHNNYAGALPLFQAALAANPRYKEALFGLGKSENKLGTPPAR
jgi:tetratricopeptide (TPR) repeat protein